MILEKLKKYLRDEIKENIFDIVVFGSLVKGKPSPRDIDLLVIFLQGALRERLDLIQEIRNKLKSKFDLNIDIKPALLKDLFSSEFLARTGILLEGYSISQNRKFCQTLGFNSYTIFWYDLKSKI